ncbi:zinc-dependent metalloprotease [Solitalea koreensis]|uniref:Zinc-dependent metalloprotease n=1 Tax=Solitalea koreensis TaxID=543615 RepID=A0A521BR09_9SPHI|nr:zinc-dependent metalloprotease [Solitalea koreensis]SMO49586.1 protein of unknown function [Solitalea koreensis]
MNKKNRLLLTTGIVLCFLSSVYCPTVNAQTQPDPAKTAAMRSQMMGRPVDSARANMPKGSPRKFRELINSKAVSDSGLFNVYKLDEKYYFEIPYKLMGKDILVVSRLSKSGVGIRNQMDGFAGDEVNENIIRFEIGPNNKVFLKNISYSEVSKDSTQDMYHSVMNSNIQPIVGSFDIKAFSERNKGVLIDFTDYLSGDNDILFFDQQKKAGLKLRMFQPDKSYISSVKSFPINTEIKTVKTYLKGGPSMGGTSSAPAEAGFATVELNSSLVLLPEKPMQPRYADDRVGYFTTSVTDFDANPQGVKKIQMITRWKLEPKTEDIEKYKRGELVEPKKPIVFYIDPATPEKWRKYLIMGVNDWQVAFEQAGFKNAIMAKLAPTKEQDSTWSIEDARYSAIVYKPSDIPNASGPNVHDPRSGEIIESHINWYHNVMKLLRNWYLIQASPNDPRARKMQFSDELMGDLIRFVSSHEVGHTLGLRHNFGSSSAYPVDKLRDKEWVKKNGHAASIMDYARFNYVAQPEDGLTGADLYPRINFYDKWAIEWGYKLIPQAKSADEETPILNKWVLAKATDKKYWFGTETSADDPRSQSEDLGDNAMKASAYGIKNLQRILPNLMTWTKEANQGYANLSELYSELIGQYNRYIGHVVKNVGGVYQTPKTVEQAGPVNELVSKATQKEALVFLNAQLFTTPKWLINTDISSRTGANMVTAIGRIQETALKKLLDPYTISKLVNAEATAGNKAYLATDLFADLNKVIWAPLYNHQAIDVYTRNLQKAYVADLSKLLPTDAPPASESNSMAQMRGPKAVDPATNDVSSISRAQLVSLRSAIKAALPAITDPMSRYHLQDLADRINNTLSPKS